MLLKKYRSIVFLSAFLLIPLSTSLASENDAHSEDDGHGHRAQADSHSEGEEVKEVVLTPEMIERFKIKTVKVQDESIYKTINGQGEVVLNDNKVAHISPKVPSTVIKVFKSVGDEVNKDEVLATLESVQLGEAKISYFSAKMSLKVAEYELDKNQKIYDNAKMLISLIKEGLSPIEIASKTENFPSGEVKSRLLFAYSKSRQAKSGMDRAEKLYARKSISSADYELAVKKYESAQSGISGVIEEIELNREQSLLQAKQDLLEAKTNLLNTERELVMLGINLEDIKQIDDNDIKNISVFDLKAPFSGDIIEKHLVQGEYVTQEQNCFTIADLSIVRCELRIRPDEIPLVKKGYKAVIDCGDHAYEGKVVSINPIINDKTRAGSVKVELEGHYDLMPGRFVTGKVLIGELKEVLSIPISAVMEDDSQKIVFKQSCSENEFAPQKVVLGTSDGINVEILDGLNKEDLVASEGAFILKAELAKGKATGCADAH